MYQRELKQPGRDSFWNVTFSSPFCCLCTLFLFVLHEGKRDESPSSVVPTMPNAANGAPDHCKTTLDGAVLLSDRHVYVFKGSYVWKLGDRGVEPGFPQRIQNFWKELPSDLDAVLSWKSDRIFFFKGSKYWRYTGTKLDYGYPKPISNWNMPDNIDTAFVWGGNGRSYFIKGNKYYRHNPYTGAIDVGYPRPLRVWKGLPAKIDAAVQDARGRTHFFSGNLYYRFDDGNFKVASGYPQSMNKYWMGCENAYVKITQTGKKNSTCPCTCGSAAIFPANRGSVLAHVMMVVLSAILLSQ